ncbi:cleavage and polyadenylation specificity factor subunit 7-like [Mirounga angustirostris]|uniref:cleavage and polyadenylation specificity factor subunit 7-like n=1 Tax=Mirounga angustirostris TaxID=9716 RepID=UPI00313D95D8
MKTLPLGSPSPPPPCGPATCGRAARPPPALGALLRAPCPPRLPPRLCAPQPRLPPEKRGASGVLGGWGLWVPPSPPLRGEGTRPWGPGRASAEERDLEEARHRSRDVSCFSLTGEPRDPGTHLSRTQGAGGAAVAPWAVGAGVDWRWESNEDHRSWICVLRRKGKTTFSRRAGHFDHPVYQMAAGLLYQDRWVHSHRFKPKLLF